MRGGSAAARVGIALAFGAAPALALAQTLELVGRSDLGGGGLHGPVAIVGTTAVVGAGVTPGAGIHTHFYNPYPCPPVAVKVVDLSDPARPAVTAMIPVPEGVAAVDVSALRVATSAFRGDLAAIALSRCGPAGNGVERGIVYYDISDHGRPVFLGRYQADFDNAAPQAPPCGTPPSGSDDRCAASQHSVELVQRQDGRVLSLSTEPGASAAGFASGDVRIVDVTDPRAPIELGSWPPPGEPVLSENGCRPFAAAHDVAGARSGTLALVAAFDGGLAVLDLTDPSAPLETGRWRYPADREVEGNAAYVAVGEIDGRLIALVSEDDWIAPNTRLRIDEPVALTGSRFACQAMFTLFDPEDRAQVYRAPDRTIAGPLVYVGRSCPAQLAPPGAETGPADADPYLAPVAGAIAVVDRTAQPTQPRIGRGPGCSLADRVLRAQDAGAVAVVILQTDPDATRAFSPDGDPTGLVIPAVMVDKPTGDYVRSVLCPRVTDGACRGGVAVRGALVDEGGAWGGLRSIDVTDPTAPTEHRVLAAGHALSPPPDLGVYAPQRSAFRDGWAFVGWGADGLVAIDLGAEGPIKIVDFVVPDSPDPTRTLPSKAHAVSVAMFDLPPGDAAAPPASYVVAVDLNSGLYVLRWASAP